MRKIRDGVRRAKEKQAESVNKQRAKKADKGNRKQVTLEFYSHGNKSK
jgi:hypothetical protein